jgi:hypothetical protein
MVSIQEKLYFFSFFFSPFFYCGHLSWFHFGDLVLE